MEGKGVGTCQRCGGLEGFQERFEDGFVTEVHFCHECGKEWFRFYRGSVGELGWVDQQVGAGGQGRREGCG